MAQTVGAQLAPDILARWLRGSVTLVQAKRELVALGYTPNEAENVLALAKLEEHKL